jgi:hypothetical protein
MLLVELLPLLDESLHAALKDGLTFDAFTSMSS